MATAGTQGCADGGSLTETDARGTFTLAAVPTSVPILQGGGGEAKLDLVRSGGFTGSVALTVSGAPAGLTATIEPNPTTGTTAILVLTTTPAVAPGAANLTVTAAAAGRTQMTTVTVAITPYVAGAGNVAVDFSKCGAGNEPVWFAFQDGTGAWSQVLGATQVFRFDVAADRGGYAFMSRGSEFVVEFATKEELTRSTISYCGAPGGTNTVSGTVVGLGPNDVAYLGMGGPHPRECGPVEPTFTLTGLPDGPLDLIAYRSTPPNFVNAERAIIRRDQAIANTGAVTVDFNAAESFEPAMATVTVTGGGSAPVDHHMGYLTGAGCLVYDLYEHRNSGASFLVRGIPAAQQRSTDFHQLVVSASSDHSSRTAAESFHTLADRIVALPAALPEPTITAPAGGHKRIQAALTLPADYHGHPLLLLMAAYEGQGPAQEGWFAYVTASFAWLGGAHATLAVPDFSGVTGWRSSFLPPASASAFWIVHARGTNSAGAGGSCREDARSVSASVNGKH